MPLALNSAISQPIEIGSQIDASGRQWIRLLTLGSMRTLDGRGPYTVEAPAEIIVASFHNISTDKLPIDYEHAIDLLAPKGLPASAAGWISKMEPRRDGVWGLVEWTAAAAKLIREKEYRLLSPVITHTQNKKVLAILRASLTNNPNLTLKSLNAAQKDDFMDHEQFMRELRAALGLPDAADASAIITAAKAATTAVSANSADPARFVPIETFQQTVSELLKLRSGVSLEAAEREVKTKCSRGGSCLSCGPGVSLCQSNKSAFDDFMEGAGKPVGQFITSLQTPHDWSKQHAADRRGYAGAEMTDVHRNLGHSAEDIKAYGGKTDL